MKTDSVYLHLLSQATAEGSVSYRNSFYSFLYFRGRYGNHWVFLFESEKLGMSLTNCVEHVCARVFQELRRRNFNHLNPEEITWLQQDSHNEFFQMDFSQTRSPFQEGTKVEMFQTPQWTPLPQGFWLIYPFLDANEPLRIE